MDGEHGNGRPRICHVVLRLFKRRQAPSRSVALFTGQFASPEDAIIAICNASTLTKHLNSLFLKDLIPIRLLARRVLSLFL